MKAKSLKFKYGMIAFLEVLILLFCILWYDVHSVRKPITNIFKEALDVNSSLISEHIDQWFDTEISMLDYFKADVVKDRDTKEAVIERLSSTTVPTGYEYIMIAWDSDNGIGTYNSKGEYNGKSDITKKPYYIAHNKGEKIFIGNITVNNLGIRSMPIMKGISFTDKNTNETVTGVIVGFLSPKALEVFNIKFYQSGHICILEEGEPVLGEVPDLKKEYSKDSEITIANKTWILQVAMKNSEISRPVATLRNNVIITSVPIGILLVIGVIIIIHFIVKEITTVRKNMDDLNSGNRDLTKRLTVRSTDEISNIKRSVNEFINNIHETKIN